MGNDRIAKTRKLNNNKMPTHPPSYIRRCLQWYICVASRSTIVAFAKGTRRRGDHTPILQHHGHAEHPRQSKQSSLIFGRYDKIGTVRRRRRGATRLQRRAMRRWATRAMLNLNSFFESTKAKSGKRKISLKSKINYKWCGAWVRRGGAIDRPRSDIANLFEKKMSEICTRKLVL